MDGRLDPGGPLEQEASRPPAGLTYDGDPEKATTGDWVLDPEAWCGWPYIHGPHGGTTQDVPEGPDDLGPKVSSDGRLCSGVLWSTPAPDPKEN